jgi:uncharacterized protein
MITNRNGCGLSAMLHHPADPPKQLAIIILSPGIKGRVAPHRLYVKIAREFAAMGYMVLRFDPEGMGDSEGQIQFEYLADVYGTIELGGVVEDTLCAMDWLEKEHNISRFILSGLCGGAITGLLTGAADPRVDALLGLGLTCIVSSSRIDPRKYITSGQLKGMRQKYVRKILDLSSWMRFLTFKTDYRLLLKSILQPFKSKPAATENADQSSPSGAESNFNPHFPGAFAAMAANRKMLLIFSGADRLYWEFEEKFMVPYREKLSALRNNFDIHIVPDANHIFSYHEWQDEMTAIATDWLKMHYP